MPSHITQTPNHLKATPEYKKHYSYPPTNNKYNTTSTIFRTHYTSYHNQIIPLFIPNPLQPRSLPVHIKPLPTTPLAHTKASIFTSTNTNSNEPQTASPNNTRPTRVTSYPMTSAPSPPQNKNLTSQAVSITTQPIHTLTDTHTSGTSIQTPNPLPPQS